MTTETTWRDEFDVVLKTIVLPGEFDILDATDRSRWLGALQQSYDAGRNKAEQYKEDAERFQAIEHDFSVMSPNIDGNHYWVWRGRGYTGPNLRAAIDKARKV